jgi:hypothetical protein
MSRFVIHQSSHHKEKIGQAIEVSRDALAEGKRLSHRNHPAFRTSANRPSNMKRRGPAGIAGHDKVSQRGQFRIVSVDQGLKYVDRVIGQLRGWVSALCH